MKKILLAACLVCGFVLMLNAEQAAAVTQADLQTIIERLNRLEAENKAQAKRIADLESQNRALLGSTAPTTGESTPDESAKESSSSIARATDEGTQVSDSGRVYEPKSGRKYYLADATANIFEPLSKAGLRLTPYGYIVFEGVYSSRPLANDWSADFVKAKGRANNTTLSVQDSIMGVQFETPEADHGWTFSGRAEFDLAGGNQNSYDFHWRHLYVDAAHESGWSILFGQTWHLWKIVSPSEIDGAWLENAGHPYRRSPQLRVTKKWDWDDSSLEARVGIVKGGPGMGGDRDSDGVQDNTASAWALFEGALVYNQEAAWQDKNDSLQDGRWLFGIGGQYGNDRSHRLTGFDGDGKGVYDGSEDEYKSMMGMVAASLPIWRFTLTGQFYAGQNLGGVQAGCGQRVSYNTYGGKGKEVRTIGGFIDLGYKLNDTWSFAVGWGCDDPFDRDVEGSLAGVDGILYNDRAYIAAFYRITTNFRLGLEYARLMTRYNERIQGEPHAADYDADRVQFSAFYDF